MSSPHIFFIKAQKKKTNAAIQEWAKDVNSLQKKKYKGQESEKQKQKQNPDIIYNKIQ